MGSHDRKSLQLFHKIYYYPSPTLRSETTWPLKNQSTYVRNNHTRNRWKIFPSVPYPHVITFCLVWQHYDMLQTSSTASKRLRIGPKDCILLQRFEATSIWNILILKYLEQQHFKDWCHVKKQDCSICPLHFESNVTFTLTTRNRVANLYDRHPKSISYKLPFGWCCCFRAYHLIPTQWNVKIIVTCKRWNVLSVTYLCVLTLLLF